MKLHITASINDTIPTMFVIVPQLTKSEVDQIVAAMEQVRCGGTTSGVTFVPGI